MNIEQAIFTQLRDDAGIIALAPLTGSSPPEASVFATSFPQNIELPAVSFFRVSTAPITYIDNELDDRVNTAFEVVAWAHTYDAAKALATACREAMIGAMAFRAVFRDERDQYNADPELWFVILEFSVWSTFNIQE